MTEATHRASPWLWEELDPGMSFAPQRVAITQEDLALWRVVSTDDAAQPGRALLVPLMMRTFIEASAPRQAGNIHVSQQLRFSSHVPRLGEALVFTFTIGPKAERKGRGWVDILVDCRAEGQGEPMMTGNMILIWAGRRTVPEVQHA